MLRLGIFETPIDDFEAPRERDAPPYTDKPQTGLSVLEIERRQLRAAFQYRFKLDLQQVVSFAVHEVAAALEVSLIHVEAAGPRRRSVRTLRRS